mmetsp:Transcript_6302/g.10871  ORF Transcript_6302/g.10871 Transcript_6302/m.10871 type:complete len:355 (+) Transcript_6302:1045-2109(+)
MQLLAKNEDWKQSQFAELQTYILEQLDQNERARLKLQSPIGVARRLLKRHATTLERRVQALQTDTEAIARIDARLNAYKTSLDKTIDSHLAPVDGALLQLQSRAHRFIDSELSLSNAVSLLNSSGVQERFEKNVVQSAAKDVEKSIDTLSDWLVERSSNEWSSVMDIAKQAAAARVQDGVAPVQGKFEYNRSELLHALSSTTAQALDRFDNDMKADNVGMQFRNAILSTAAVELGAAGIGYLLASSLFDVTLILPSSIALTGLALVPLKRRQLKQDIDKQIDTLRKDISGKLRALTQQRAENTVSEIRQAIVSYETFVQTETVNVSNGIKMIDDMNSQLDSIEEKLRTKFPDEK